MKKKYSKKELRDEIFECKCIMAMMDDEHIDEHKSKTIELMSRMCKKWQKIVKVAKALEISDKKLYDLIEDCIP